jgi:hypothetical protein
MREYLDLFFEDRQLQKIQLFKRMIAERKSEDKQEQIAKDMGLSNLVITKLLSELTHDVENEGICDGTNFEFDIINRVTTTEVEVEDLKRAYLRDSIYFRIVNQLLFHEIPNQQVLLDALKLSPSTYYKRIRELNDRLRPFDIEVTTYRIIGIERRVRHLLALTYATYFSKEDAYIPEKDYERSEIYIANLVDEICQPLNDWQMHFCVTMANITRTRLTNGQVVQYETHQILDLDEFDTPLGVTSHYRIKESLERNLSPVYLQRLSELDLKFETIFILKTMILIQAEFQEDMSVLFSKDFAQRKVACIQVVSDLIYQKKGIKVSEARILKFINSIRNIINEIYSFQDSPFFAEPEQVHNNVLKSSDFSNQLISTIFWKIIENLLENPLPSDISRFHARYFQEYLTKLPTELDLTLLLTQLNVHFRYSHMENNRQLITRELKSSLILACTFEEDKQADVVFTDLRIQRQPDVLYFIDNEPLTLSRWQYIEQAMLEHLKHVNQAS